MGTKTVLLSVRTFVNGTDLTGMSNKLEIAAQCEEKETTNFASAGWKELVAGIYSATLAAEGMWSAGDFTNPDDALNAALGTLGPWTAAIATPAVGDIAWFMNALTSKYTVGGAVGDVAPWQAGISSSGPLVRGQFMHPPGTARTSTGTGTSVQVGAVPAGYAMYVALHVLSVSGTSTPTITVKVTSDDNSGFTSGTDQGTFTAVTAANQSVGQIMKIAAPITDTWWRIAWTISGTSPSFLLVAAMGLGPA